MTPGLARLKFDDAELEESFREDYYEKSILTVRIALILGAMLYSIFGVLDSLIAPESVMFIWIIRFGIVLPILLLTLLISFTNILKRYMQFILSMVSLIAGFGIVAMIAIAVETDSSLYYYAGLMLVLMWTYTFVKLFFFQATIVCWIIVLGYEFVAIFIQELLLTSDLIKIFINNNFFFISSNIIGMFACYLIELYTRNDFLQRLEISKNREELKNERNELQNRIIIMDNELEMARIIQQKFIPHDFPKNIFSIYEPMEAVGGDLIDFIKFRQDSKVGIFVSDVSGHGVPAALVTSMIKSSIVESHRYNSNPAKLLIHLNDILKNQTEESFVTAFYCIFDESDRSLIFSNAGHHPPVIIKKNKITLLEEARSLPLAVVTNTELDENGNIYKNCRAILPNDCKLVMYTDGLVEAKKIDDRNLDFGDVINQEFLNLKNLHCKEFVEGIYEKLKQFHGSSDFDDDICVICLDIM